MTSSKICSAFLVLPFLVIVSNMAISDVFHIESDADDSVRKATEELDKISGQRISDFLNGINSLEEKLVRDGSNEGKLALLQGANEIQIARTSAIEQFGAEVNNQIKDASVQLRPFLIEMQRWRDQAANLQGAAVDLEDSVAIDLGRLPLAPDYFGIRRVTGTALIKKGIRILAWKAVA